MQSASGFNVGAGRSNRLAQSSGYGQYSNRDVVGQEETDEQTTYGTNPYHTENQKIEYVTKSYTSSAWCCQSSETAYD